MIVADVLPIVMSIINSIMWFSKKLFRIESNFRKYHSEKTLCCFFTTNGFFPWIFLKTIFINDFSTVTWTLPSPHYVNLCVLLVRHFYIFSQISVTSSLVVKIIVLQKHRALMLHYNVTIQLSISYKTEF